MPARLSGGCWAASRAACPPTQIAAASPVSYVDRSDPPMLLIVGGEDTLVPTKQTLEMARDMTAAGVKHDVIVLPGINHSFIGRTAEATRDANLKALAATFEFIDRTLAIAPARRVRGTSVRLLVAHLVVLGEAV